MAMSSWVSALVPNDWCSHGEGELGHRDTQTGRTPCDHEGSQAEIRVRHLMIASNPPPPPTPLPAAARRHRGSASLASSAGTNPANTLAPDFQPRGRSEPPFVLFEPPRVGQAVLADSRRNSTLTDHSPQEEPSVSGLCGAAPARASHRA